VLVESRTGGQCSAGLFFQRPVVVLAGTIVPADDWNFGKVEFAICVEQLVDMGRKFATALVRMGFLALNAEVRR
jgi:hypothetical protein